MCSIWGHETTACSDLGGQRAEQDGAWPAGESPQGTWLAHVRGWILKCISLPNKLKKKNFFFLLESFLKKYQLESPNRLTHPELLFSFLQGSQDCSSLQLQSRIAVLNTEQESRQQHVRTCSWKCPSCPCWEAAFFFASSKPKTSQPSSPFKSMRYQNRSTEFSSSLSKTDCHKMLKLQLESLSKIANIFSIIQSNFFFPVLFSFPLVSSETPRVVSIATTRGRMSPEESPLKTPLVSYLNLKNSKIMMPPQDERLYRHLANLKCIF